MPAPGLRIGNYQFVEPIGAGGMGEVWHAQDIKLGRSVAIKTLQPETAANPERLARLRREAELLAALNHPNIASIHGLEEDGGVPFLVLEYVEGETLSDRLLRGSIPLAETLEIARQIATALETAHERGIVHRDLKPSNIKIKRDGRLKVLDFGLAKPLNANANAAANAPTLTRAGEHDVLLGTPAYMSPEQARGEEIDTRTDIWAFGTILTEMLTGRPLFQGPSAAETLARVIQPSPVELSLPSATPPLISRLVGLCLRRNPAERLRHIGDARIDLEDVIDNRFRLPDSAIDPHALWSRRRIATAVGLGFSAAATGGWIIGRQIGQEEAIEYYDVASSSAIGSGAPTSRAIAISPDGLQLAYANFEGLFVHSIETGARARVGKGSEPFFAPDSQSLAFFGRNGGLYRVSVTGGEEILIADGDTRMLGGGWGADGRIYFALEAGLFVVPDDGSAEPDLLLQPDAAAGERYGWPEILPGSRALLFTILPADASAPRSALLDLTTGVTSNLSRGERARYVRTGHLLVADEGKLKLAGFDLKNLRVDGKFRTLNHAVSPSSPSFDVSATTGTLIYLPPSPGMQTENTLVDLATGSEEAANLPRFYIYPRFSADGKMLVGDSRLEGRGRNIFIWDFERGIETPLTTDTHEDMLANWGPDGETVYFNSKRGQRNFAVFAARADRQGEPQFVYADPGADCWLMQVVPARGTLLIVASSLGETHPSRFLEVDLEDPTRVNLLLSLETGGSNPVISPNGELMAYQSNETRRTEIWVRSLDPDNEQQRQVSAAGGRSPVWAPDGNTLYFQDFPGDLQAVEIRFDGELDVGKVNKILPNRGYAASVAGPILDTAGRPIDIGPAGRLLTLKAIKSSPATAVRLVRSFTNSL